MNDQQRTLTEILDDELNDELSGIDPDRFQRLCDSLEMWKDQQLDDAMRLMKNLFVTLTAEYEALLKRTEAQEHVLRDLQIRVDELKQFRQERVQ